VATQTSAQDLALHVLRAIEHAQQSPDPPPCKAVATGAQTPARLGPARQLPVHGARRQITGKADRPSSVPSAAHAARAQGGARQGRILSAPPRGRCTPAAPVVPISSPAHGSEEGDGDQDQPRAQESTQDAADAAQDQQDATRPASPILPPARNRPQKAERQPTHTSSLSASPTSFEIYSDDGELDEGEEERQEAMVELAHCQQARHPSLPVHQQDSVSVADIQEDTEDEEQAALDSGKEAREGAGGARDTMPATALHPPDGTRGTSNVLPYIANCSVFVGRAPSGPAWNSGSSFPRCDTVTSWPMCNDSMSRPELEQGFHVDMA